MNFFKSKTYIEDLDAIISNSGLDSLKGSKILITGANGLIATVLVDSLSRCGGIDVYALCRSYERAQQRFGDRVNYIIQDVTEVLQSNAEFDYIIHAASNAHPIAYSKFPADTMKANVQGTINVLEYAVKHSCKRVLFLSSSEVYGQNDSSLEKPLTEDYCGCVDISDPRSAYPESKRAGEALCAAYLRQYGINTVCVRPSYVFGATMSDSNSRADAQFFRKAMRGESIVLKSPGTQLRSYVYVSDCAAAVFKILLNGDNGPYNIAGNDVVSIRNFAEMIADSAKIGIAYEAPDIIEQKGYSKALNSVCSIDRARGAGYVPRVSAAIGIERTLKIRGETEE
jgi:nucleoside-diphosphate-sugar epimerase